MNILYHHRTQGKGVERVHILGIVESWRKMGHRVDILSPPGVTIEKSEQVKQDSVSQKNRWQVLKKVNFKFLFECLEFFYNFWAILKLKDKINNSRYQLIFERYSFLCWAGAWAANHYKIPFFLEVNYTSSTPIFRKRSRFIQIVERYVEKKIFSLADGIIVVSSYLKDLLISQGVRKEKIIVLPNAADPEVFNPRIEKQYLVDKYQLDNKKVVGFIGYFYPWHGIDLLLETYKSIESQVTDVVFLLIGDGPTYSQVKETIEKQGVKGGILLVGRIPHVEIQNYIALFDIAIMPDSNNYGSPMKILEYMAMEKAVIAPKLGPLEDIIVDGKNGLLFTPRNKEQLSLKIVELLKDDKRRFTLGENARHSIINTHNWYCNAEKILALYHKNQRKYSDK